MPQVILHSNGFSYDFLTLMQFQNCTCVYACIYILLASNVTRKNFIWNYMESTLFKYYRELDFFNVNNYTKLNFMFELN